MAKARPMKIEDLFKLNAVGKVALSPDGRRVAFELKRFDLNENKNFSQLMLADAETGRVRQLTKRAKHNDTLPRFSPDGKQLGFLSTRNKVCCLWIMPMDGGEARRLTDRDGNVKDFAFSPNSRRIAYTRQSLSDREKLERDDKQEEIRKGVQIKHITRLTHKLDGAGFWNGHYTHVYVTTLSGAKPKLLTRGDYDHTEPRFSPDGKTVSFVANRTSDPDRNFDQADIYTTPASGGRLKRVTQMPGDCGGHAWSPDGKTIAFTGMPNKVDQWWKYEPSIWLVDSAGGKPRRLTREIDNHTSNVTIGDISGASFESAPPIWSKDGSRIFFLVSEHGETRLYSRSISRKDLRCEIGGNVNVYDVQRTASDGPIAVAIGTATNPGDVFLFDPSEGAAPARLSNVNAAALKRIQLIEPEEFWLKSGNRRLHCWVMKPAGFRASRKHPAVLEIHGGPQAQYGYSMFHEMQMLVGKGYVVAYCNPRGSAGYGLDHRKSIIGDWGGDDYTDIRKITDWLLSRPWVDKKRVGVTGGSYGGYMTNWVVGHEQRFRAAVTQRSCVNFESFVGTGDFGHVIGGELMGLPWDKPENLRRQSPFTYVKNIKTPLLILHSEQDLRCPLEQAEQLFTALKYLGREVELVKFEGESHGLSRGGRPQNRAERLRRMAAWFDKYLR